MKGERLYAVCYVTGYTSEAEMQVFHSREDAEKEFDRKIRNTFGHWLDSMDWDDDDYSYPEILKKDRVRLRERFDIYIDSKFDITWDGSEVYERVYLEEIYIQ